MEFQNLKIFNTEIEAEMVKAYLEAEGIPSFVFGNILANTYNLFNTTSGGVILKVYEKDYDQALALLNAYFERNIDLLDEF